MSHRIAVALVLVALSAGAHARGPRLELPSFAHLESQAVESVDITLGRLPLRFASWFIDEEDSEGAEARQLLKSIKSVSVRHFRFGSDFVYSMKDLDAVRSQLSGKGWSRLVQVRDRRKDEDVDVFLSLDDDRITGVAIVVTEPREFTIVNIVGKLDMDQVERWASHVESGKSRRWDGHDPHPEAWDSDAVREERDLAAASPPDL
jgi:hypothetical protein